MLHPDQPAAVSRILTAQATSFSLAFAYSGFNVHFLSTVESLFESKAVTKSKYDVHKIVVGRNDFTAKDITVQAHAFTKTARAAIEGAGGKCEILKPSTGAVIEA
jgi:large subunit ribosomal protein L15